MAGHDAHRHAARAHQRGEPEADGLEPEQVDLLGVAPARIVFAEARRLDEGQALEFGSVGTQVLAGVGNMTGLDRRFRGTHQQSERTNSAWSG